MNTRHIFGGIGLVAALTLTACGGGGGGATGGAAGGGGAGGGATLNVAADPSGQLQFQQKELNAAAGQPITVDFKNPAPLTHNWVLVQPGQEQAVADAAAAKNGDVNGVAGVIKGGTVVNPNGEEQIQVPPQQAGTYTYICTVPGHYAAGMKGTLNVK